MVDYKQLIEDYANDSQMKVQCVELPNGAAQIICVEYDTFELSHAERGTFKKIFYDFYAEGLIEGIENYDYVIVDDHKGLASDLLKYIDKEYFAEPEGVHYIRYVNQCDKKGVKPEYYYDWEMERE